MLNYQRVCFRWHQQIWILVASEQVDEYWRLKAEAEFHCRSNGATIFLVVMFGSKKHWSNERR